MMAKKRHQGTGRRRKGTIVATTRPLRTRDEREREDRRRLPACPLEEEAFGENPRLNFGRYNEHFQNGQNHHQNTSTDTSSFIFGKCGGGKGNVRRRGRSILVTSAVRKHRHQQLQRMLLLVVFLSVICWFQHPPLAVLGRVELSSDRNMFLYASLPDEEIRPVIEYQIHLAPSPDFAIDGGEDVDGEKKKGHGTHHVDDVSDIVPFFLSPDAKNGPRVVNFYSSWCGHCRKFVRRYVEVAREITEAAAGATAGTGGEGGVKFYAVSCSEYDPICVRQKIKGYPTIMAYKKGEVTGTKLNERFNAQTVSEALGLNVRPSADENRNGEGETERRRHEEEEEDRMRHLDVFGAQRDNYVRTRHDVYLDAALSFTFALRTAIYPPSKGPGMAAGTTGGHQPIYTRLPPRKREILVEFFDLLYWALPPTWTVHSLINDLRVHKDEVLGPTDGKVGRDSLMDLVNKHHDVVHEHLADVDFGGDLKPEDYRWTESCSHGMNSGKDGYLCGLWNLLHIATVGVAERHKAVLGGLDRVSPNHAARAIRDYLRAYLGCEICVDRFQRQVARACNGRDPPKGRMIDLPQVDCDRRVLLTSDELLKRKQERLVKKKKKPAHNRRSRKSLQNEKDEEAADDEAWDWREMALWLWEVHNGVNVELVREEKRRNYKREATKEEEKKAVWPSTSECPACWTTSDELSPRAEASRKESSNQNPIVLPTNFEAIYSHLKTVYWPGGVQNFRFVVLDKKKSTSEKKDEGKDEERHRRNIAEATASWKSSKPSISRSIPLALLSAFVLSYFLWSINRRRIFLTGRHKKFDQM